MIKICSFCNQEKSITDFPKRRNKCKKCYNADRKEYQQQYRDNHKTEFSAYRKRYNQKTRLETMNHYGGAVCSCCGDTTLEFLGFDHIDGGGNEQRKKLNHGQIYRWLKSQGYPSGYRVLCHNCNMSIGFYGYCPHQSNKK